MTSPPKLLEKFIPNPKLKLREQLREVMRFKHFSHRTESAYWCWTKGFILFHEKRHPREMGAPEVQAYLSHLATHCQVAPFAAPEGPVRVAGGQARPMGESHPPVGQPNRSAPRRGA